MEQITPELLQTIRKRAVQYCVAAYNNGEPDEIHIEEDGTLRARWFAYNRGYDDDYEYFSVDKLAADLDEVYAERKRKEEDERKKQEEYNRQQQKLRTEREREERRRKYNELKKEFEG